MPIDRMCVTMMKIRSSLKFINSACFEYFSIVSNLRLSCESTWLFSSTEMLTLTSPVSTGVTRPLTFAGVLVEVSVLVVFEVGFGRLAVVLLVLLAQVSDEHVPVLVHIQEVDHEVEQEHQKHFQSQSPGLGRDPHVAG